MAKILEVIKYEGDNSTFVWKHPCEDFNTLSQLVVHEGMEAVLFKDGQALDQFGPGRHTLLTQNIPLLKNVVNIPFDGKTPFSCEVYYINKTVQMAVKWGTDSKVRFLDPIYGVPLELGASGEMNLMVSDAKKLLSKLIGTTKGIAWDKGSDTANGGNLAKSLAASFRPMISSAVKSNLSASIKAQNINVLEIDENLGLLSDALKGNIQPGFEEYGLTIPEFYITSVLLPESDPNFKQIRQLHTISLQKKMAEADAVLEVAKRQAILESETTEAERQLIRAQTEAKKVIIDSQAQATKRSQEGYTYQQERGFDVASEVARNEAVGQFTNLGVGLGTMAGIGGAVAGTVGTAMNEAVGHTAAASAETKCAKCGAPLPAKAKFCLECGEKVAPAIPENMVVCPQCGNTVAKGKFCPECGHKFITACPKCGQELVPGAKFCLECGEKI